MIEENNQIISINTIIKIKIFRNLTIELFIFIPIPFAETPNKAISDCNNIHNEISLEELGRHHTPICSEETFGHLELNKMVSDRGKSKGCVPILIERKTRPYTAI